MVITILHNPGSSSARNLQAALRAEGVNATRALTTHVRQCRDERRVINLGVNTHPHLFRQRTLVLSNTTATVEACRDKRQTLLELNRANVPCLEWVDAQTPLDTVREWLEEDGKIVLRHTVTGHSGAGIQIIRRNEHIPPALMYTRYFRKQAEYRVHVAFGNVILIQQKRKRNGFAELEGDNRELVRTHGNGWVFTTAGLACDERGYAADLRRLALDAANAVGAGHCAVDILVKHNDMNDMVVCEINSCPAIEADSTLAAYTQAFKEWLND